MSKVFRSQIVLQEGKMTNYCLIIYADDMVITGINEEDITNLKKKLFMEFEMKDLGT